MAYPFTDDHDMIREAARSWLSDWYESGKGPEAVYQSGQGYDPDAWASFAGELGMAGIAINEAYGGADLGDLGRVVVMEELGASLCSLPFFTTGGIVADLIAAVGTEEVKTDLLGRITRGELSAAYCDGHDALQEKDGTLSGAVKQVVFAAHADMIFMSVRQGGAIKIIALLCDAQGLTITPHMTLDPTRSFADVSLENVAISDITIIGEISETDLQNIIATSFIALAAECVGGAQKCLDITLEYTGQRVQFDRPIAGFQAVKHRCADMFIAIEAARSAVYGAAIADADEKVEAALIAKAVASEMFFKVAGDAIQMHGGIGFTWEYPLHYFFKRARANMTMFGTASRDYERLAGQIFGEVA